MTVIDLSKPVDPRSRRSRVAAAAILTLAPVSLLVSGIVHPTLTTNPEHQLEAIAERPDAWYFAHITEFAGTPLLLAAVLILAALLWPREPRSAPAISLVEWQMAFGEPAPMADLLDRSRNSPGIYIPFEILLGATLPAGLVGLTWRLERTGVFDPAVPLLVLAFGIVLGLGFLVASRALVLIALVSLVAGFALAAATVLANGRGTRAVRLSPARDRP